MDTCSMWARAIWNFSNGRLTSWGKIGKTWYNIKLEVHTQEIFTTNTATKTIEREYISTKDALY